MFRAFTLIMRRGIPGPYWHNSTTGRGLAAGESSLSAMLQIALASGLHTQPEIIQANEQIDDLNLSTRDDLTRQDYLQAPATAHDGGGHSRA